MRTVNSATSQQYKKKRIEKWYLETARNTGSMIPGGVVVEFEEPDFQIQTLTGVLGIELTEFLPPGDGALPVEAEAIQSRALKIAERLYYSSPDAVPVRVFTYRNLAQARKLTPHGMAVELVEYVKLQLRRTKKSIFTKLDRVPEGFGIIQIDRRGGKEWNCGRTHHGDYSKIFAAFASLVSTKNSLVQRYRTNLPGSEIWLLVYSGVQVARSVSIPAGADKWVVPTAFDKVLFFSSLSNPQLIEIARS